MTYFLWAGKLSRIPTYPICLGVERATSRDALAVLRRVQKRFPNYQFVIRDAKLTARILASQGVTHDC